MQNLAGHPKATELIAIELQKAGIPIEMLDVPYGEPRATLGGSIGKFIFRRAWVYWTVSVEGGAEMSESHARQINDAPRDSQDATKYSGGDTWGGVIRVDGFSGGTSVSGPVDSWHIDTPDGLAYFADRLREFGYA